MNKKLWNSIYPYSGLIIIFGFFFVQLPQAIQNLDSAELVANSYKLILSHPPGYPLYHWLYHFFLQLFSPNNVFWGASILNLMFAMGAFFFLLKIGNLFCKNALISNVFILHLVLATVVWRYSLIPDVFSLHACLLMGMIYFYFKKNWYGLSCFSGLAFSHHQISIFLVPLIIHAFLIEKNIKKRIIGILAIFIIPILFYLSLFVFDDHHLYAWTYLNNIKDLFQYILRMDYGTFSLSGAKEKASIWINAFIFMKYGALQIPYYILAIIIIPIWLIIKKQKIRNEVKILFLSLFIYLLVFCTRGNLLGHHHIFERFLIQPWFILATLAMILSVMLLKLVRSQAFRWIILIIIIVHSGISVAYKYKYLNLKEMWIYEDYIKNAFRLMDQSRKNIVITDTDTKVFGFRYYQIIYKYAPNTYVFSMGNIFNQKKYDALLTVNPRIQYQVQNVKESERDIINKIIVPNIAYSDFYLFLNSIKLNNNPNYHMQKMLLGYKLIQGNGRSFSSHQNNLIEFHYNIHKYIRLKKWQEIAELHAEYTYYYLEKAKSSQFADEIITFSKQAIDIFPYCFPAYYNLCYLKMGKAKDYCLYNIEKSKKDIYDYFK